MSLSTLTLTFMRIFVTGLEGVPAARGVIFPRGGHPLRRLRGTVRAAKTWWGPLQDPRQPQEHARQATAGLPLIYPKS